VIPLIDELREVREATPLPLMIGSGMTENDVERPSSGSQMA